MKNVWGIRSELTFHVGGAKMSLWLRLCRKFVLQNVGRSEWVQSRKQLSAWRIDMGCMNLVIFKVYAGTCNLKTITCTWRWQSIYWKHIIMLQLLPFPRSLLSLPCFCYSWNGNYSAVHGPNTVVTSHAEPLLDRYSLAFVQQYRLHGPVYYCCLPLCHCCSEPPGEATSPLGNEHSGNSETTPGRMG